MQYIRNNYLRKRFFMEIVAVILIITICSGYIQFILLREQKDNQINVEATMIAKSIQQGILNTNIASRSIEHQIDLKMITMAQLIAEDLQGKEWSAITNRELEEIRKRLRLSGITLFAKVDGEIKGVRATDPKEIGFSFRKFGKEKVVDDLLRGIKPTLEAAYTDINIMALPVAQSGSHTDKPTFFKYVYYHPPGATYFINVYTEANEVYQLTQQVGPDKWIENFYAENPYVKEIGVLNLRVMKDLSLEKTLYPPMKKVEHGSYRFENPQDIESIKGISSKEQVTLIQQLAEGERIFKMFIPLDEDRVIYIGFDYKKMLQSLYSNSTVHLISVVVSLIALFFITVRFFKKIKQAEQKINYMAFHDELTNLPNRRMLKEKLKELISEAKDQSSIGAFYLDLDNFKYINDTFGHSHGDELIRSVAHRIQGVLKPGEIIARMGGDEFIILLPGLSDMNRVEEKAVNILKAFIPPFLFGRQEMVVNPSIGISLYPKDGEEMDELIQKADMAMYHAKQKGKNNFQFFSAEMKEKMHQKVFLEKQLRKAIENQELILHYQTKVNISSGTVIGVEALVRWNHPEKGLLPPMEFIPFAEETGLIVPIGEWVLREAVNQIKTWNLNGFPKLPIAVNLSARQFYNKNLLQEMKSIVSHSGIDPRDLELEITESTMMDQPEASIGIIKDMKEMGIGISMDDFGTGYSSLHSLKRIPIDRLKVDRSFIKDINQGKRDNDILRTIISLGKSLDLEVIAEGVETKEQLEVLRHFGCDHVQGYLFGKPVGLEELEERINIKDLFMLDGSNSSSD